MPAFSDRVRASLKRRTAKRLIILFFLLITAGLLQFTVYSDQPASALPATSSDLVPFIDVPALLSAGEHVSIRMAVANQGPGNAEFDCAAGDNNCLWKGSYDMLVLSSDSNADPSDRVLIGETGFTTDQYLPGVDPITGELAGYYLNQTGLTMPQVVAGTYYLILIADAYNVVTELNEANNTVTMPITVMNADLSPDVPKAPASASANEKISVSWNDHNYGNGTASSWNDGVYLSSDPNLDASDTHIGGTYHSGALQNVESPNLLDVTIPNWATGNYYLLVQTDYGNTVFESIENNNVAATPIAIMNADLGISGIALSYLITPGSDIPGSIGTGDSVSASITVYNQGEATAYGKNDSWSDSLYLSEDDNWDPQDVLLGEKLSPGPLVTGASYENAINFIVPDKAPGTYYLIARAAGASSIRESNENNNIFIKPITIIQRWPDLTPVSLSAPDSAGAGWPFSATWEVYNQGDRSVEANTKFTDRFYLSSDALLDSSDVLIREVTWTTSCDFLQKCQRSANVRPQGVELGTYYLLLVTDGGGVIAESNENNNVLARPIRVTGSDLVIRNLKLTGSANAGEKPNASWTVYNQGESSTFGKEIIPSIYISSDPVLDDGDYAIATSGRSSTEITPGGSIIMHTATYSNPLPVIPTGSYFLIVSISTGAIESNYDNNEVSAPLEVYNNPPVISAVQVDKTCFGSTATFTWTTDKNTVIGFSLSTKSGDTRPSTPSGSWYHSFHKEILYNLVAGQTYYYRISSKDAAGNVTTTDEMSFTMPTGQPTLSRIRGAIYWRSYVDFLDRSLSVDYSMYNIGKVTAYRAQITEATATSGVTAKTPLPVNFGDIAPGAMNFFTITYHIPYGVSNYRAMLNASAQDGCGQAYGFFSSQKDNLQMKSAND